MSFPAVVPKNLAFATSLPLWLKLVYTAFLAVLIPVYWWNYGPTNFLYFCDVALLLTLIGIWRESSLPISMAAVGILAPQVLWVVDFVIGVCGGRLTGMTDYMFNPDRSLFLRGLSLFHGWLPFLLLYLVWRLGYDRKEFKCWTAVAWMLILVCYFVMPGPHADAALISTPVNINYVHGMSDMASQTWMPSLAWLGCLLAGLPLLIFSPTHLLLRSCFDRGQAANAGLQPQSLGITP
jgi:hypothetical protein